MPRYLIIVQPADGRDFWLSSPSASDSDAFARWIHKSTGAAVRVHDHRTDTERLTLGSFDATRT